MASYSLIHLSLGPKWIVSTLLVCVRIVGRIRESRIQPTDPNKKQSTRFCCLVCKVILSERRKGKQTAKELHTYIYHQYTGSTYDIHSRSKATKFKFLDVS
jgi:hypothetical protein